VKNVEYAESVGEKTLFIAMTVIAAFKSRPLILMPARSHAYMRIALFAWKTCLIAEMLQFSSLADTPCTPNATETIRN
jgi:phage tail sheath protein FI